MMKSEEDLIEVVVLDCDGNKILAEEHKTKNDDDDDDDDNRTVKWKKMQIDRSLLGEEFQTAPVENIALQQLVDQPGSFIVVLYDELETERVSWNPTLVSAFIECYKKNKSRFESGTEKKKVVWEKIASDVESMTGQHFTCLQIQNKWKQMTRKYREIVKHNSVNGNAKKSCSYFAELLEVFQSPTEQTEAEETDPTFEETNGSESTNAKGKTNGASPVKTSDPRDDSRPSSGSSKWSRESVQMLTKSYRSRELVFKTSGHRQKRLWQEIADVIEHKTGQHFTWLQVQQKWKNHTNRHRDVIFKSDKASENSKNERTLAIELNDIFKDGPDIKVEAEESGVDGDACVESRDESTDKIDLPRPRLARGRLSFGRGAMFKWNSDSVLVLINCYEQERSKLLDPLQKKKQIWQEIAKTIGQETGQQFTWFQVEAKWKNLTKKFRDVVDRNSRPGKARRICSFYAELKRVYKYRSFGKPAAAEVESDTEAKDEETSELPLLSGLKRPRFDSPTPSQDPLLEILSKMHNENKALAAEQMAMHQEMHREKMAAIGQLMDVLKTVVCKKD